MYQLILLIHVFAAICVVALVLVQQGKGATMGAAFGSGASQTVFGSRGSGSFMFRITISFIIVFFITSISLNYLAMHAIKQQKTISLPAGIPQTNKFLPPAQPADGKTSGSTSDQSTKGSVDTGVPNQIPVRK